MRCPNCLSENVQVHYDVTKQGFSGGKGCCGAILFGPLGLLCGLCGKNHVTNEETYWICQKCGKKFDSAQGEKVEKLHSIGQVIQKAGSNLINNPNYEDIVNKKNFAKNTLKQFLSQEELKRFIFTDENGENGHLSVFITSNYASIENNFDLSNECIYFMYDESLISGIVGFALKDFDGTIFTSKGIYHTYRKGLSVKPKFTPISEIKSFYIEDDDIFINEQNNLLDFTKIKNVHSLGVIKDVLVSLYINDKTSI